MIDPITAFATAQTAIKGVQAAIKMGRDLQGISGDLMKFFEAKDVVAKAAVKPKRGTFGQSDTAAAFETVMHAKQLQDAENELKEYLYLTGHDDVWQALMLERNAIVARRKAQEKLAEKARAKRAQEIGEVVNALLLLALAVLLVTLMSWGTLEYVKFMRS